MPSYCALTLFTLSDPQPDDLRINPTALVGFGLLLAERDETRWQFERVADVALANESEALLAAHLADRLPLVDHMVGWQIERDIVDPLLIIAERLPATERHFLLSRLARTITGSAIDLAIGFGGPRAPPFAEIAGKRPIVEHVISKDWLEAHWRGCDADALRTGLANEALGLWRAFLANAPQAVCDGAMAATNNWLARGVK